MTTIWPVPGFTATAAEPVEVEARVDLVTAALPVGRALVGVGAERGEVGNAFHHVVAEELRVGRVEAALRRTRERDVRLDGRRDSLVVLRLVDIAVLEHVVDDQVASRLILWIVRRVAEVERVGRLNYGDEARGLGNRQFSRRRAVVALCGGFDAVGGVAESGQVQVAEQDLVFGVFLLERDREPNLLHLARRGLGNGLFVRGESCFLGVELLRLVDADVLHDLHGDRRSAGLAGLGDEAECRAGQRLRVDRAVLVVPAVFTGDRRILQKL
jgi:hypothetical protein